MIDGGDLALGLGLAACFGAVGALLPAPGGRRPRYLAAGVVLGVLAGQAAIAVQAGQPLLPPRSGYLWALLTACGLAPLLLLPLPTWLRWTGAALVTALAAWCCIRPLPLLVFHLGDTGIATLAAGIGGTALAAALGWEWAARGLPERTAVLPLLLASICAAAAIAGSSSLVLAQHAGVLCAALAGCAGVQLILRRPVPGLGLAAAPLAAIQLAVALTWLYADLPLWPALLVLAGPGLAALACQALPAQRSGLRLVAALVGTLVISGTGAVWAILVNLPAETPTYY